MSNSPLVAYTKISPNKTSPRNHVIDTVTIHCVVGQVTAESLGDWFAKPSTQASSNYGVDKNGRIGMYVEEKDRSWCTSSKSNDHRAITIEVASDTKPPYVVTEAAYSGLIKLLVDICKRNPGIKNLRWEGNESLIGNVARQNMTVHRWFKNKACPGDFLYSKHADIVAKVNALLEVDVDEVPEVGVKSDEVIWNFFKEKGLNNFAIAGILGNLEAESGLRSNNLQNGYEQLLNHTDASYTKAVDNGSYTNFVKDKAGYGLAQWTYHSRKKALLDYANSVGKSIGDLGMQLDFMWKELQGYKTVITGLKEAKSVLEASNLILLQYEKPADQSEVVQTRRARYGQEYFDKFTKIVETPKAPEKECYRVRKTWDDSKSQLGAYEVFANAKKKADENPGYFVFDNAGKSVYPEKKQVIPAKSKSTALSGTYLVTAGDGLNLRYEPGKLSDDYIVKVLRKGAVVQNYGYYTVVDDVKWLYVRHGDETGFIHSKYVRKI